MGQDRSREGAAKQNIKYPLSPSSLLFVGSDAAVVGEHCFLRIPFSASQVPREGVSP